MFNRFPDVDFGECAATREEIEFSYSTFTQINALSSASEAPQANISISLYSQSNTGNSKSRREETTPTIQSSPAKRSVKSREDRIQEKAQKEQSKAYEKALKSAQAANKKCAKATDCLKVLNFSHR